MHMNRDDKDYINFIGYNIETIQDYDIFKQRQQIIRADIDNKIYRANIKKEDLEQQLLERRLISMSKWDDFRIRRHQFFNNYTNFRKNQIKNFWWL